MTRFQSQLLKQKPNPNIHIKFVTDLVNAIKEYFLSVQLKNVRCPVNRWTYGPMNEIITLALRGTNDGDKFFTIRLPQVRFVQTVRDFLTTRHFALNGFCNTAADFDNQLWMVPKRRRRNKSPPARKWKHRKEDFSFLKKPFDDSFSAARHRKILEYSVNFAK